MTDANTGRQVATAKISDGPDAAAFDAGRGLVYSSNGDGTLAVIHQEAPDRYRVAASVQTQRGARTMALDAEHARIYLVTADFGAAPAASADNPHPRPVPLPDSFTVLVVGQ